MMPEKYIHEILVVSDLMFTTSLLSMIQDRAQQTTSLQILLQWNIQRGCPVIPRSTSNKNIKNNIEGAFDWELSETQKVRHIDQGW